MQACMCFMLVFCALVRVAFFSNTDKSERHFVVSVVRLLSAWSQLHRIFISNECVNRFVTS